MWIYSSLHQSDANGVFVQFRALWNPNKEGLTTTWAILENCMYFFVLPFFSFTYFEILWYIIVGSQLRQIEYLTQIHMCFISLTNAHKIPKKTIVITILSARKKNVKHQHYWESKQSENPESFANQNFHFLSFGSSWCRIAYAFIPGGGLIWSEAWKLKSQLMSACQSIVISYGKLFRLGADKSEPIWSGL